jgi:NAD(P)-dependent dehydrogenase (short-subunit alcohol dehydrogenase family)
VTTNLTGKRVLILGAETEIGRAVTTAVAEAGATVAAVAATSDAEAAFAVQRLTRRLSSGERKVIAQAIDATNEAAVRVMVRQVTKELGGLDAVVFTCDLGQQTETAFESLYNRASTEMFRRSGGVIVALDPGVALPQVAVVPAQTVGQPPVDHPDVVIHVLRATGRDLDGLVVEVLQRIEVDLLSIAGEPDSG